MKELFTIINKKITKNKQYACFDFDHTCINNDVQEMTYVYQVENFKLNRTPQKFKELLIIHEYLDEKFKIYENQMIALEQEAFSLYEKLYKETNKEELERFSIVMLALFEVADKTCDSYFTYQWVLRLLEDYDKDEITKIAHLAFLDNYHQDHQLITKHSELLSTFNLQPRLCRGFRANQETLDILHYLKDHHIDVYMVSASSFEVIKGILDFDEFKDLFNEKNMFAIKIHTHNPNHIITIKEGKEKLINFYLAPLYNDTPPMLCAGDSTGDFWMMKMQGQEGIRVVVGHNHSLKEALENENIKYINIEETI